MHAGQIAWLASPALSVPIIANPITNEPYSTRTSLKKVYHKHERRLPNKWISERLYGIL